MGRRIDLRQLGRFVDNFLINLLLISIVALVLLFVVDGVEGLGGILIVIALMAALLISTVQQ